MIGLLLFILFFAVLIGVAGGLLTLTGWYLLGMQSGHQAMFALGTIASFCVGCFIGFGGMGGGAAAGMNWYGGDIGRMLPIGLLACISAGIVCVIVRETRQRKS